MSRGPTLPSPRSTPELRKDNAHGSVPGNRGKNTTLLASLSLSGIGASMSIEGAVNTVAFELYGEPILAPSLSAEQIVVMDNLSEHKGERVHQLIEAHGSQLLFLPASSPDYSPIEETFSKVKAFLRRVGARTHEALQSKRAGEPEIGGQCGSTTCCSSCASPTMASPER